MWEWAFEDARYSPLLRFARNDVAGFTNATTGERLDFFQVKENATHLCTALTKHYGLRQGCTVSLFSQNTIWYPVAMFAVLRAGMYKPQLTASSEICKSDPSKGGRVNGASPAYSVEEMTNALHTAEAKFIMTVPNSIKVAVAAAENAGIPKKHIFLLEGELENYVTLKKLIETGKKLGKSGQSPMYRIPKGQTNDVCGFLTFSSGTTGLPKAVSSQPWMINLHSY